MRTLSWLAVSPLEPGPIYAPGAGPPHPALQRRRAKAAVATLPAYEAPAASLEVPAWTTEPQPTVPVPIATTDEHRRFDWVLGIVIGIVLGLAVAAGFVFLGSEDTVDAPRIHGIETGKPAAPANGREPTPAETEKLPAE
jgi:hypothetical protein